MGSNDKFGMRKIKKGQKNQKKRKFKILKKIVMQNVIRKVCTNFHDPRTIGCGDMTAERYLLKTNNTTIPNTTHRVLRRVALKIGLPSDQRSERAQPTLNP